jgi:hypothetical protein
MQFHVEMTPALVQAWLAEPGARQEIDQERRAGNPGVQSREEMLTNLEQRTGAMGKVAVRLYDRWAQGLRT